MLYYNKLFPNSICFKWKELNFVGSSLGTVKRLMIIVEIHFLSLNNQSKLESWYVSLWEIWNIMNIPKWVENKLSRKTETAKNKTSCQSTCTSSLQTAEFLTRLLLPFPCLSKLYYFGFEHWQSLPLLPSREKIPHDIRFMNTLHLWEM